MVEVIVVESGWMVRSDRYLEYGEWVVESVLAFWVYPSILSIYRTGISPVALSDVAGEIDFVSNENRGVNLNDGEKRLVYHVSGLETAHAYQNLPNRDGA